MVKGKLEIKYTVSQWVLTLWTALDMRQGAMEYFNENTKPLDAVIKEVMDDRQKYSNLFPPIINNAETRMIFNSLYGSMFRK